MESTSHQPTLAKNQCTEEDRPINTDQLECVSSQDPQNELTIENVAFSQYPVFANILKFLNPEDLENCWYVSKHWRKVTEPLILLHYDIKIVTFNLLNQPNKPIILTKRARFNRRNLKRYKLDFEAAAKILDETLLTEKVVLSLSIHGLHFESESSGMDNFLTKFGPYIQDLSFLGLQRVPLNQFANYLLTKFPNIESLNCSALCNMDESPGSNYFSSNLPKDQLSKLKKIDFGMYLDPSLERSVNLLKMAPKLEEIENLPLWLINAVVIADKAPALKSLTYRYHVVAPLANIGVTVLSTFQKLAQLNPKLSSFYVLQSTSGFEEGSTIEMIKPFVFSILQSSADSLRSFEMGCTEWYGFQDIPQLKGVKTLVFPIPSEKFDEGRCFPPHFSHREKFPNVTEICFQFDLYKYSISSYFPEIVTTEWGSQIKRLHVRYLPSSSLPMLQTLFPSIEDLEFSGSTNEIAVLLPAFPNFWSQLRSLKILVTDKRIPQDVLIPGPMLLDCAFTGLPLEVVSQLLHPSKRGSFSDDQIQDFKNQSTICKIKKLQRLTLTLDHWCRSDQVYPTPTHVSYEFGFRLLPHLKVSVVNLDTCFEMGGKQYIPSWSRKQSEMQPCIQV